MFFASCEIGRIGVISEFMYNFKDMKKTLLIGNFGARNIGDELILLFAVEKNKNVVVMTADPRFSQEFCGSRFETISPFPSGIRSLIRFIFQKKKSCHLKIDRVVFPGGGLFAIKTKADFIWWCQFQWAKKLFPKALFILEYQGVDSKEYFLHKFFIKSVFSKADKITVRDQPSVDFLKLVGIKNIKMVGDRVEMQLEKKKRHRDDFKKNRIVLIHIKKLVSVAKWKKVLKHIPENYNMVFVCFDSEDARFVPKGFKGEVFYPHTKKETYDLFENASMAIGQRLHFLILAEYFCGNENIFVLGKPYAEKVENFCKKKEIKML